MNLTLASTLCESPAANAISAMDNNWVIATIVGVVGFLLFLSIIARMSRTNEQEKTRREVAAYVAEGSMTPEEGERLLNAGKRSCG